VGQSVENGARRVDADAVPRGDFLQDAGAFGGELRHE
jgi:hypothetical protein